MKKNKNTKSNVIIEKISDFYTKSIKKSKIKFNMLEMVIIMLIVFGLGLVIGGIVMYGKGAFKGSNVSLNEFVSTYDEIVDGYYQEVDKDELLEAGISGMVKYLGDPYSTYLNKDDAEDFNEDVDGTYQGIGAEIKYNEDGLAIFGQIMEDSPAEKAGFQENDCILKVNDIDVRGKTLAEISSIVKGDKGTSVNITIKRNGEEKTLEVIRDVVNNISVYSELIIKNEKRIGYLGITVFAGNTTKQFKKELEKLEKENIESLIIDVRGNSGGYLTTVTDIISMFIEKNKPIYQLKTKDKIEVVYDETDEARNYPIVVLADRNSASASELLVGALGEIYGAEIVGTRTFGKGKVQKVITLSSGALFKYTYQEWLTPEGNSIDQEGIEPTVEIKYSATENSIDNQKDMAIDILSE